MSPRETPIVLRFPLEAIRPPAGARPATYAALPEADGATRVPSNVVSLAHYALRARRRNALSWRGGPPEGEAA
jgi:hypothetical protein